MPLEASPLIGILALQGSFEAHAKACAAVGARTREVRVPSDLDQLDGLIIPGGESTTIKLGIEREGLFDPLREFASRAPVMATCAGAIVLSTAQIGAIDIDCERNAYGRQIHSFEAPLAIEGLGDNSFNGVFIRAPRIVRHGSDVKVLGWLDGDPVAVVRGRTLVLTFHPELTGDDRLHRILVELATGKRAPYSAENHNEEAA